MKDSSDLTSGNRVEFFPLPKAGKRTDVRLRFAYLGRAGGHFGIDNLAFYERPTFWLAVPKLLQPGIENGILTLDWVGEGVLEVAEKLEGPWVPSDNQSTHVTLLPAAKSKFFRIKQ